MKPRADFACLSKACNAEEGATVYELPVDATHCPKGHKRLRRIWTPPHVNTKRIGDIVDPAMQETFDRQKPIMDAAKEARSRHPAVVTGPATHMGPLIAQATGMPQFAAATAGPNKPANLTGSVLGSAVPHRDSWLPTNKAINRRPRPALVAVDPTPRPRV